MLSHNDCFNHYERILVVMLLNTIILKSIKLLWYLVADYTELSLRIIKSVESEKGNPSLKTLEKIAGVLGLELVMRVKIINE